MLCLRLGRLFVNPTNAVTGFDPYLNITVVSPLSTPRVLDDDVFLIAFLAVSDSQHSVVNVRSTLFVCDHSRTIKLENSAVCLYPDSHWTQCDCRFQLRRVVFRNVLERDNFNLALLGIVEAVRVMSLVRVVDFTFDPV